MFDYIDLEAGLIVIFEFAIGGAVVAAALGYLFFKQKTIAVAPQLAQTPVTDPLIHKLAWVKYLENIDDYGRLAAAEYDRNRKLYELLQETLQAKFNREELTYERYSGAIELTSREFRAAISKLIPVLEGMDLDNNNTRDPEKVEQVKGVLHTCDQLNESFDKLLIELAKLSDQGHKSNSDVEYLLKTLQDLTDRVKNYL